MAHADRLDLQYSTLPEACEGNTLPEVYHPGGPDQTTPIFPFPYDPANKYIVPDRHVPPEYYQPESKTEPTPEPVAQVIAHSQPWWKRYWVLIIVLALLIAGGLGGGLGGGLAARNNAIADANSGGAGLSSASSIPPRS